LQHWTLGFDLKILWLTACGRSREPGTNRHSSNQVKSASNSRY
jgi:hypothetical protein